MTQKRTFADWLDENTGAAILGVAGLGLLSVAAALFGTDHYCGVDPPPVVCGWFVRNPPWIFLTTLVAAPPALLTWYWRTMHKKKDLANARSSELNARFSTAVDLLAKGGWAARGAVYALEQLARDSETHHWPVIETLCGFVRELQRPSDFAGFDGATERDVRQDLAAYARLRHAAQAALAVIGRRDVKRDPAGSKLNLTGGAFSGMTFAGGDFSGADFTGASLTNADFRDASVRSATFRDATLFTTNFMGADMTGASLTGMVNPIRQMGGDQFWYDDATKPPATLDLFRTFGLNKPEHEAALEDAERSAAEDDEREAAESKAREAKVRAEQAEAEQAEAEQAEAEQAEATKGKA